MEAGLEKTSGGIVEIGAIPSGENRAITLRSFLIGSAIVVLVCAATPYNDYVVANTYMVGSYLPLVMVLCFFLLVVVINGLLHRLWPGKALQTGELAVIMLMTLVACSLPSQGFLRAFLPTLLGPFHVGKYNTVFWEAFLKLNLPGWLYPVEDIAQGRNSDVLAYFYSRVPAGGTIPYRAWIVPLLGWGVFIAGLFATLGSLAWLVRQQWGVNERLPFPLVQLEYSLIEPPAPGRCLNSLFSSRAFWLAAGAVFVVHGLSGASTYFRKYVPVVPLTYDLSGVLSNEPWVHLPASIKTATIYFTFIGITYFIQARTAFSLWATFLILQLVGTQQRWLAHYDIPTAAWRDQHLGAALVYLAGMIWIGRQYWWKVIRHALAFRSSASTFVVPPGCRAAVMMLLGGIITMLAWLLWMRVSVWMACLIVFFLILSHVVTARIVAETGMPYVRAVTTVPQVYTNLPTTVLSGTDVYFAGVWTANGAFTTRESLLGFSQHGLRVCDRSGVNRPGWLATAIIWSLLLGFFVGVWSSLHCYYTYATPLSQPKDREEATINRYSLTVQPFEDYGDPLARYADGRFPQKPYRPFLHFGAGVGIASLLQLAAWRLPWWPFTPVGYLLGTAASQYIHMAWFSLFLGWLAKVLILRFGGAPLFQQSRSVFIGIIFGEALAAGFWLIVTLALAWSGFDYTPIRLLPT